MLPALRCTRYLHTHLHPPCTLARTFFLHSPGHYLHTILTSYLHLPALCLYSPIHSTWTLPALCTYLYTYLSITSTYLYIPPVLYTHVHILALTCTLTLSLPTICTLTCTLVCTLHTRALTCTDTTGRSRGRSRGRGRWRSAARGTAHTAALWSGTRHWWPRATSRGVKNTGCSAGAGRGGASGPPRPETATPTWAVALKTS